MNKKDLKGHCPSKGGVLPFLLNKYVCSQSLFFHASFQIGFSRTSAFNFFGWGAGADIRENVAGIRWL